MPKKKSSKQIYFIEAFSNMGLIHEHRDERKPGHAESEDSGYKKQK